MTRVLVTGATTPIGEKLVEELLRCDEVEQILAVGFGDEGSVVRDPRVSRHDPDLSRERPLRRLLFGPAREARVNVVVHLALHRSATLMGSRIHALNVESTRRLLQLAERHPTLERLVFRGYAEVMKSSPGLPTLIDEEHPLELSPKMPQWVRDRVEADLAVSARMGMSDKKILLLRTAECLAPDTGSQLYDYLTAPVCFRPMGYDPMINVISVEDVARALRMAALTDAQGIFCIPGADTLPLSDVIRRFGRRGVPMPGPLMRPLYGLRQLTVGGEFRYDINRGRLHFSGSLDGRRAKEVLGYEPRAPLRWARP
jgi:UDP-glucose 4-epimerase